MKPHKQFEGVKIGWDSLICSSETIYCTIFEHTESILVNFQSHFEIPRINICESGGFMFGCSQAMPNKANLKWSDLTNHSCTLPGNAKKQAMSGCRKRAFQSRL